MRSTLNYLTTLATTKPWFSQAKRQILTALCNASNVNYYDAKIKNVRTKNDCIFSTNTIKNR